MLCGLIHIQYHDKKLLLEIKKEIDFYKNQFGQVPKWLTGADCKSAG